MSGNVVITGASAGVGLGCALAFARRGWRVGLIARGPARLESAARAVENSGGTALPAIADVADAGALGEAADRLAGEMGGIDMWVNNAMATVYGRVGEVNAAEYRRVTEVTYLGAVHGTLAALKHMRPAGGGTIVQIGSALAHRAIPLQSAYCAAKFAMRGFTDSLRSELEREASPIRLTMIQLPAVNTPQFDWARSYLTRRPQPVPPIYDPEDIGEAIYAAALDAPREFWIAGSTLQAIAGDIAAPGLMDRIMAEDAFDGQHDEAVEGPRPDNLFEPVEGDYGLRGRFTDETKARPVGFDPAHLRAGAFAALAAGAATLAAALIGRRVPGRAARLNPRRGRGWS